MLTFEQIKELIQLIADRRLAGLELERSGFRLRIDGQAAAPVAVATVAAAAPAVAAAPAAAVAAPEPAASAAVPAAPAAAGEAQTPSGYTQRSPMVGTFYRSPNPEAPPFVEIGQRVKRGQTLCILEAMKLMNEIEAEVDGVVTQIYPQNGAAVEFDEPLFLISP